MDDALWRWEEMVGNDIDEEVLILVLMDDALWHYLLSNFQIKEVSGS